MTQDQLDANKTRTLAKEAILGLVLETIRRDNYPSATMMNIVQSHLSEDDLPDYLGMLMDKMDSDRFPSMDMIRRIVALT